MTDKELLERAAKAAQLPECGWMGGAFVYVKDDTFTDWDPLNDDGDAFRLATALELDLNLGQCGTIIYRKKGPNVEEYSDDYMAAARRAIVRAAAELSV